MYSRPSWQRILAKRPATMSFHSQRSRDTASSGRSKACLTCHQRKVRCNICTVGSPCTTCTTLGVACQQRPRKAYPNRTVAAALFTDARSKSSSTSTPHAHTGIEASGLIGGCQDAQPLIPEGSMSISNLDIQAIDQQQDRAPPSTVFNPLSSSKSTDETDTVPIFSGL